MIIMFVTVIQAYAGNSYSQNARVSLELNNVTIQNVLDEIENQSEFFFLFNRKLVDVNRKVDVSVKNQNISNALAQVFANTNTDYVVIDRQIVLSPKSYLSEVKNNFQSDAGMQPRTVTGTVTDANGAPLVGVTVMIKGTSTGTITDEYGNYTVTGVPEDGVLVFSFVGMKTQEINVGDRNTINVTIEVDPIGLEEVVAVGYGTMRKTDLTGSVARANMEIFDEAPNVNVLQSLHGSVPGLNVGTVNSSGASPSLSIRGTTNFAQENSPLIVLDGIIYRGNMIDINPNDIESIDILKDASSTAIYGSQASNGVILITTKKKGIAEPVISYNFSYSHQTPSNIVEPGDAEWNIQSIKDSYWELSRLAPDYIQPDPDFDPAIYFKTVDYRDGYYQWLEDGTETDWWDLLTGRSFIMNHDMSLSGASENFNYYISTGLANQDGIIENDNYKRYSFRINISSDVTDWLNIGVNTFMSLSDNSGASVNLTDAFEYFPLLSPYDEDGEIIVRPDGNRLNPLQIKYIDDFDKRNNLNAIFHTDIKLPFLEGFNYRLNLSVNNQSGRFYQFNPWGNNLLGEGFKNNSNTFSWTADNIFTYVRRFADDHNVNLTLVYGVERRTAELTHSFATDFDTKVLGYNSLEQGSADQFSINSDAWEESSLYGMARAVYTLKNKYILTGTVRRDGFSGFAEDHKFGVFPSAALGWIISEEGFMQDRLEWLSYLKIRGSYGSSGRRALSRYQTLAKAGSEYSYVFGDQSVIGRWLTTMSNPELRWETTTGINIGMDFGLLNSRIFGNIEYYNSNTKDIIYDITLPRVTGFEDISSNVGKIHNYGLEMSVNGSILQLANFSWDATANYSMNRDEIVSIIGADNDEDGIEDDLIADGLFIGEPLNVIYGFENIGMWQLSDQEAGLIPEGFFPGTYIVKNLDDDPAITREGDRKILGYEDPSYRIGLANTLRYKNFTLRMFIYSVQGGKNYYYSTADNPPGGNGDNWDNYNKPARKYYDYWLPENPDAKYRRLDKGSSFNTPLLSQRNFIRLQDISLSYRFSPDILRRINVNTLRAFVSGKNLLTITKWNGWDPETGQGLIPSGAPVFKSYTVGVEFEF